MRLPTADSPTRRGRLSEISHFGLLREGAGPAKQGQGQRIQWPAKTKYLRLLLDAAIVTCFNFLLKAYFSINFSKWAGAKKMRRGAVFC